MPKVVVRKPANTPAKPPLPIWTYFVTRDSREAILDSQCELWWVKPLRTSKAGRVIWCATSEDNPGHLGRYPIYAIERWFGTRPDTDREMIVGERPEITK